jgi:hypothetical protein
MFARSEEASPRRRPYISPEYSKERSKIYTTLFELKNTKNEAQK